jgi:polygalacturonase
VDTVTFKDSTVIKSDNGKQPPICLRKVRANSRYIGIRVKATEGTTGTIKGVTYSGITLSSIAK